jgi:hypothetical protein
MKEQVRLVLKVGDDPHQDAARYPEHRVLPLAPPLEHIRHPEPQPYDRKASEHQYPEREESTGRCQLRRRRIGPASFWFGRKATTRRSTK